jgi:hypothetical protein
MRQVLSLVAAVTLLASGGVATAGPLTLTDSQLDKVTAGGPSTASSPEVVVFVDCHQEPAKVSGGGLPGGGLPGGALGPAGMLGPGGMLPGATH